MKKFFAILLALSVLLSLSACASDKPAAPTEESTEATTEVTTEATTEVATEETAEVAAPMTHEEYMAAELEAPVCVETYVQAHQSWWSDKITVYAQSEDGAYFLYNMACSEEDAAKLVPGTKILVNGFKGEWAGEVEITDATFEILEGEYVAEPVDVTELLGSEDLIQHQNELVSFKDMTVASVSYKNDEPGDDIYVSFTKGDVTVDFCVEAYLTGPDSDVYAAVGALNVGDVVDVEGFLYWYNGANTHMTAVNVVTPAPAAAAEIPVKVYFNSNAEIEAYNYVEGDETSLAQTSEVVNVGNKLAIKVIPAEGYKVAHVRVNSKSVEETMGEYWVLTAAEGVNSYKVKVILAPDAPEAVEAAEPVVTAEIPVKVYFNSNAEIEAYNYVEGDETSLAQTSEVVNVGNKLAIKVIPAEGYKVAHVRVNSKSVEETMGEYWVLTAAEDVNSYKVKVILDKN